MNADDIERLAESWRAHPPPRISLREVEDLLVSTYSAYEIPLEVIPSSDLIADEEVREEEAAALLTITDPAVLPRVFDACDREMWQSQLEGDPAWLEQDRRFLFEDPREVGFRLLHMEQSRGQRATILLQARGELASGFRIYNAAGTLAKELTARIGPDSFVGSVEVGDVRDAQFARYLVEAKRLGLLQG